jgi:ABC-type polar amino acid transport system ATPase subunit
VAEVRFERVTKVFEDGTAGLEGVTEGEIRIGGEVVNDIEARRREIAMVFQNGDAPK